MSWYYECMERDGLLGGLDEFKARIPHIPPSYDFLAVVDAALDKMGVPPLKTNTEDRQ